MFTRPGIASILPPSRGIHQEWITSQSGAVTLSSTVLPAGARSVSIETAPFGYRNSQKNCWPTTSISSAPPEAVASGEFAIPGSFTNTKTAIAKLACRSSEAAATQCMASKAWKNHSISPGVASRLAP